MADHRIRTSLGSLVVRVRGNGPPALLWHGMFVDGTSWDLVAPRLAEHRTLFIVDGPGHGMSDTLSGRSSIRACALVTGELVDGLGLAGPVDWVGNAWGGHVGMRVALDATVPLRSLVVISAPPEPIGPALRRRIRMLPLLLRGLGYAGPVLSAVLASQLTDAHAHDPELRRRVVEALRRPDRAGVARAVRSFVLDRTDMSAELPRLRVPTLFVASDDRAEFAPKDAERAARIVPRGAWTTVPDARALIPLERPEPLAAAIIGFWADTIRGPAAVRA